MAPKRKTPAEYLAERTSYLTQLIEELGGSASTDLLRAHLQSRFRAGKELDTLLRLMVSQERVVVGDGTVRLVSGE